jgi:hypothetical protein
VDSLHPARFLIDAHVVEESDGDALAVLVELVRRRRKGEDFKIAWSAALSKGGMPE